MIHAFALGLALAAAAPHPVMLEPGNISTSANEFGGAITPDGRELWYSSSVQHFYMETIFFSRRLANGHWGPPLLAPFSGRGHDFDPNFSPDGHRMVFTSDRPTHPGENKRDYDIWYVDRMPDGRWGTPHRFDAPINSVPNAQGEGGREEFASLAADGTLYVACDPRDGAPGGMAIYVSRLVNGHYETPVRLPDIINAGQFVGEPMIAPDQSFMLFSAFGLPGGHGNWDIYVARRGPDGQWQAPENLGPAINTAERDYSPRLMPDGHTLHFTSERYFGDNNGRRLDYAAIRRGMAGLLNGQGNIYSVDLRTLGLRAFPAAR
jgi:hypothetical protein